MARICAQAAAAAVVFVAGMATTANADVFKTAGGAPVWAGGGIAVNDYYKLGTEDGTHEDSIGFQAPGTVAYANKFTIDAGGTTITDINIQWGAASNGVNHTFAIWTSGGNLNSMNLASTPVVVAGGVETGDWVTIDIPDVAFSVGQEVFVGFLADSGTVAPNSFFGAWDNSAPHTGQSYIWGTPAVGAFGVNNIGTGAAVGEIGGFGLAGDWTIRANAVPAPGSLALLGLGGLAVIRRRR